MIVDTMTFEEVAKYLNKTCFNEFSEIRNERLYLKNEKLYNKAINKWNCKDELLMFKPIISKGEYDLPLISVPYVSDMDYIVFCNFTILRYKGKRYVAHQRSKGNIWFYSWHSLERYSERFLEEKDAEIDIDFISEMLVYNFDTITGEYIYKGRKTIMMVVRDGAFLCEKYINGYIMKTFISQQEYFSNQDCMDKELFASLNLKKFLDNERRIER